MANQFEFDAKSILALNCLDLAPPLIRQTLFEESDFRDEYGLATDSILSFGDTGLSIDRRELLDGIRKVLAGHSDQEVIDTNGRKWLVQNNAVKDELPRLSISRGDLRFSLYEYFVALSPDTETRLRLLEKTAFDVNLPRSAFNTGGVTFLKSVLWKTRKSAIFRMILTKPRCGQ